MNWQFNPFLLIPILSTALNASLAWFGWRRRPAAGAGAFALVMLAVAIWSAGNALELGATDLPTKVFWMKLEFIGILLLPAAWLVFALQYTGHGKWLTRRAFLLLAVEPVTMLILLWTNEAHGWFFHRLGIVQRGTLWIWDNLEGPLYWINVAYSYFFISLGILLLLRHLSQQPAPYSNRELAIAAGSFLPLFSNILYNLYGLPMPGLDPTPFAFTLSGLAYAWGVFSLRLLDVHPAPAAFPEELPTWRLRVLNGILRGGFIIWLFALAGGIYNVVEAYQREYEITPHLAPVAIGIIVIYISITLLIALITFRRNLSYSFRAGVFLFILYLLGALGLALASLSGDGRVFLLAFVILAAIFFGLRFSLFAAGLSLATLVGMGWLQVSGILIVPAERQINSTDAGAWISGTIVFIILGAAALISITYLMGALEQHIHHLREALTREQRLTRMVLTIRDINQLIVRERDPLRLLEQACKQLIAGRSYAFVWIGLLGADGVTLKAVAYAGKEKMDLEQCASHLDLPPGAPTCAVNALRARRALRVPEDDPCAACPMLAAHPGRISLALPLIHEGRGLGALVVDQTAPSAFFDEEETALLEELADDLAHALAALRAAEQQRLLAELSGGLLFAPDEEMLWTEVIIAVQKILHAERVAIYLYNRETDTLSCPRSYGLSEDYINELNRRFHEAPGSAVLREPRPVIIQNVETDPAAAPLREWMLREGFRSYAVFPFFTSKGMVGAFTAYRDAPSVFTASDLAAGETLVRMIGLALENINLNAETRRKASELGALYAAAQEMASSLLDSHSLLLALARHVTETLHTTSAYITSVNLEERTLRVVSEYWSAHATVSERKSDLNRVYPLDDYPTFCRVLISSKAEVLHDDTPNISEAERLQFEEYSVRSILFIPVMAHGKMLGGIEVWESRRRREFTQAEIALAQAMAGHAASILQSAQLFEKLEQSEARFRALIENAVDGIAVLEADATFRYLSPSVEHILGYRAEDLVGRNPFDFIHPGDREQLMAAFAEGIANPDAIMRIEYRFQNRAGQWLYLEAVAHNLLNDPAVRGVVVNYRDMTERKHAEEKVRRHAAELEELSNISSCLRAAANLAEMLPLIVRHAVRVVHAATGSIFLLEEESGKLVLRSVYEAETDRYVDYGVSTVHHHLGEGITGHVAQSGEAHFTDDLHSDPLAIILPHETEWLRGIRSGLSLPLRAHEKIVGVLHVWLKERRAFSETETRLLTAIAEMAGNAIHRASLHEQTLRHANELALAYDNTLAGWARALELRDELTEGHTRRVTDLTEKLARAMGLSEEQIVHIRRGAILHDIGKMGIPDSILHKSGSLSPQERALMRRHPQFAYDMLYPIEFLRPALDIPWCHHERWDGTGYPRGLKGEEIPLAARLFAVADVWDALTSDRPYRPAWSKEKARQYIVNEAGKHFDPDVVKVFLALDVEEK
ncbi:MAG: histidine kinase N-terminal 7TM domain-containing protein [Anaerolineales bacterium]|nr:histidine kinase N-terminal 7TM domain-containing protein [Anaerolineales bacterium]